MSIAPGNVYVSKLKYGQLDSDSVSRLQVVLKIAETSNYDDATDTAVIAWQKSIGDTPDPVGESYLGPKQANLIFKNTGNTVIDDTGATINSTTLGTYLKSKGHAVDETDVPYGRDSAWTGVKYIMVHHTVTPDNGSEAAAAVLIRTGREYPPLAQIMLGQSGKVWICSRQRSGQAEPGRASHAGKGSYPGVPTDRMNEFSLGIECQAIGTKPLSSYPVMYKALIKLIADLCARYGLNETKVIGHKEWSSTGKIDPLDNMNTLRADVKAALGSTTVTPPTPEVPIASSKYWHKYSGKPKTKIVVKESDGWYRLTDIRVEPNPIGGKEDHMLYARINFVDDTGKSYWKASGMAIVECKYVRDGGTPTDASDDDATAYDERHYQNGTKSIPFQQVHWEEGEKGVGGYWWVKVRGGVTAAQITTRYAKAAAIKVA